MIAAELHRNSTDGTETKAVGMKERIAKAMATLGRLLDQPGLNAANQAEADYLRQLQLEREKVTANNPKTQEAPQKPVDSTQAALADFFTALERTRRIAGDDGLWARPNDFMIPRAELLAESSGDQIAQWLISQEMSLLNSSGPANSPAEPVSRKEWANRANGLSADLAVQLSRLDEVRSNIELSPEQRREMLALLKELAPDVYEAVSRDPINGGRISEYRIFIVDKILGSLFLARRDPTSENGRVEREKLVQAVKAVADKFVEFGQTPEATKFIGRYAKHLEKGSMEGAIDQRVLVEEYARLLKSRLYSAMRFASDLIYKGVLEMIYPSREVDKQQNIWKERRDLALRGWYYQLTNEMLTLLSSGQYIDSHHFHVGIRHVMFVARESENYSKADVEVLTRLLSILDSFSNDGRPTEATYLILRSLEGENHEYLENFVDPATLRQM
ncbi:hypothetical protein KA012_04350 [Candidatus Woesebacteria bacterium]|nr:hypothetical protein [Candidatus Woesebacteria bacterium]